VGSTPIGCFGPFVTRSTHYGINTRTPEPMVCVSVRWRLGAWFRYQDRNARQSRLADQDQPGANEIGTQDVCVQGRRIGSPRRRTGASSEKRWHSISVKGSTFEAAGDPSKLEFMLQTFLEWAEVCQARLIANHVAIGRSRSRPADMTYWNAAPLEKRAASVDTCSVFLYNFVMRL
jgi:hypothetical protein